MLLLYLAIDRDDDRPLIIDQPEENLDPKSINDELVGRFRKAKHRRVPAARRDIEDRYITENIIERFVRGNVLRGLTHDKGKLGFGLINDASRNVAQLDTLAGSHQIR